MTAKKTPSATLRKLSLAMIGTGKMGQAIVRGLLNSGLPRTQVVGVDASAEIRSKVKSSLRIRMTDDAREAVSGANVVLLSVKPQQMAEATRAIAGGIGAKRLVISIAAGIPIAFFEEQFPGVPIVRVMPNLPATVGAGFSAIACGRQVKPEHRAVARAIFRAVGAIVDLPETHFDAITAVSGSGPAYLFYLMQAWREAARKLGLDETTAQCAILETVKGSVRLYDAGADAPQAWIAKVASKGGTTEAALRVLDQHHVAVHIVEAIEAAAKRSKELTCPS